MIYETTSAIQTGIPGTNAKATAILREPVKPNRNQLELFKRTCGPDEQDAWFVGTLEIMEMIVARQGYAFPSDVYRDCAVQPYENNWWGAFWRERVKRAGYRPNFNMVQKSPTPSARGRVEAAWTKAREF